MDKVYRAIGTIAAWAGILALMWLVWCWSIPQVWVGGPESVTSPDYLVFSAVLALGRAAYVLITGVD